MTPVFLAFIVLLDLEKRHDVSSSSARYYCGEIKFYSGLCKRFVTMSFTWLKTDYSVVGSCMKKYL